MFLIQIIEVKIVDLGLHRAQYWIKKKQKKKQTAT